jgi:1-acyl-sn-glycerol-3-phosphate acyltransferase
MFSPYCVRTMAMIRLIVKPFVEHFIKITSTGLGNLPSYGPFVLVSNHRSDLDPLVIGSVIPRYVAWIADAFLFNIPVVNNLLRNLGAIPISTRRQEQLRAFRRSREVLRAGHPVGIFPEGHDTIVRGGARALGSFHAGFAELAAANRAPVLPVTVIPIEEEVRPLAIPTALKNWLRLPEDVARAHDRLVYRRVHVEIGQPIDTCAYSGGLCGKAAKTDVSHLVARTRLAIGKSFSHPMA